MNARKLGPEDWQRDERTGLWVPRPYLPVRRHGRPAQPTILPFRWPQSSIAARTSNGSSTNTGATAPATYTISFGTSTVSTDAIVLYFSFTDSGGYTSFTLTAPSGWTQIHSTLAYNSGSNRVWLGGWVGYKGSAGTSFSASYSGTANTPGWSWVTQAFTGVNQTTIIDSTGTSTSNSGSKTISDATWNVVAGGALPIAGVADFNLGSFSSTAGPSYTAVMSSNANQSVGLLYAVSAIGSAGGATGATTITDSASATGNLLGIMPFALNPAAASFTGEEDGCSVITKFW